MSEQAPEPGAAQPSSAPAGPARPAAKRAAAKKTTSKPAPARMRVRMVGTGPDYIDGTVKVLPVHEAQRLIRLGHAR